MNLLVLGRGKTGALVAEYAIEHGHQVHCVGSSDNRNRSALTREKLQGIDVVVDFTTPAAVMQNIEACVRSGKNVVVGTTGWYGEMPRVRDLIESSHTGFVYGANFSFGVNLFFEIAQLASEALKHGYGGSIEEIHHVHKKDAPSGTALKLQQILQEYGGKKLGIASIREGDASGTHTISLESGFDNLTLTHESFSRRGFAEGAVKAAEWLKGKTGFYEFREIFHEV